ncbi:MAG: type II secretion system protein M [Desulfuromonadales bacterium]|nr:type II secretion system protein M [Desulfuromonadales bacterium]
MNALRQKIALQSARIDALSFGRRLLLFGAVVLALVLLWYQLWASPLQQHQVALEKQISQTRQQVAALQTKAQVLTDAGQLSPELTQRRERETLEQELARLDIYLQEATQDLVSPQEMAPLLEDLLRRQEGVRLVRLESLGTESLLADGTETTPAGRPGLYRHAMRLEVEGGYLATLNYLQQLEKLPKRLIWENLEVRVEAYPTARVSLTVYTLSMSRGWIGV